MENSNSNDEKSFFSRKYSEEYEEDLKNFIIDYIINPICYVLEYINTKSIEEIKVMFYDGEEKADEKELSTHNNISEAVEEEMSITFPLPEEEETQTTSETNVTLEDDGNNPPPPISEEDWVTELGALDI